MGQLEPTATGEVRAAEVIASMCLATDLGMGFPFEHGFHATLTTMRLCKILDVDEDTVARTYYACLLMYAGCTVDGVERSQVFGGGMTEHVTHRQFGSALEGLTGVIRALPSPGASLPRRTFQAITGLPRAARFRGGHFAALCEVAGMLAERLGVPRSIYEMFPFLTERWDGAGVLKRASGDEIPLPLRIIHVGRDATYQRLIGDDDYVTNVIASRAGHAFDPEVAAVFLDNAADVLGPRELSETMWEDVLASEPRPWLTLEGPAIDQALGAIGAFSDLVSPHLTGHCSGVAQLAAAAADLQGLGPAEVETIRRAALVHDVGRTAVGTRVWNKPGQLTADEREQVRLHPYHTERVLARSPFLSQLAPIAMAHHERLDGSGYHRGLESSSLSRAARLLAVADAFQSKTEPRPYREPLSPKEATEMLVGKAREGVFDPVMVMAVAEAAGQARPAIDRPAGLTEREVEVVGLLARGLQTKQIARELDISAKTVDRHIQNSYRKIGVSSRAAATLFATENGLVPR
ncbi:MAG TPA: HD domain-containing phosphohydrolase [Acidimicrobiia bacterium]|nr:HD domain-containing phosphohydrolase [Acidimicrobiia bacterium]